MAKHITAQPKGHNKGNGCSMINNISNSPSMSVHGHSASKMSVKETNAKFAELAKKQSK